MKNIIAYQYNCAYQVQNSDSLYSFSRRYAKDWAFQVILKPEAEKMSVETGGHPVFSMISSIFISKF